VPARPRPAVAVRGCLRRGPAAVARAAFGRGQTAPARAPRADEGLHRHRRRLRLGRQQLPSANERAPQCHCSFKDQNSSQSKSTPHLWYSIVRYMYGTILE
jgi:hypothetical protein